MRQFQFRLATNADRELIHTWLGQEHIKEWFPGEASKNTVEDLDQFFVGPSIFKHWIAYEGETPFAYLLTSEVVKSIPTHDIYAKWCLEEGEAITLDMFMCNLDYLGKGLAVKMIHDFLKSQFPKVTEVFIDPEVANARAVHVYKKAGFEVFGEFNASWHPVPHYRMRLSTKKVT